MPKEDWNRWAPADDEPRWDADPTSGKRDGNRDVGKRDVDKLKDRNKDNRDQDKGRRESDRHKDRDREKDRGRDRVRDKDRDKPRDKDRDAVRDTDRDKHRGDRDKDRDRNKDDRHARGESREKDLHKKRKRDRSQDKESERRKDSERHRKSPDVARDDRDRRALPDVGEHESSKSTGKGHIDLKSRRSRSRSPSLEVQGKNARQEQKDGPISILAGYSSDELEAMGDGGGGGAEEDEDGVIKVATVENGNEISMSVEETNRVRQLLGLKPLNLNSQVTQDQIAVENLRKVNEEKARQDYDAEVARRVQKAKNKRDHDKKLEGPTLGEVKEGEAVGSAADWVKASRQKAAEQEKERRLAEQRARQQEEQDRSDEEREDKYDSKHLAGLKVVHDAAALGDGEQHILTLQDSDILERDEHGVVTRLAEGGDVLENVTLKEAERRKELRDRAKRAKLGAYNAYDDEQFEEDAVIGPGAERKVLAHYDEEKKRGPRMVLQAGGVSHVKKEEPGAGEDASKKIPESLLVERKALTEYYTSEEMAKFNKPKKMRKKVKEGRTRGRQADGIEAAIAATAAQNCSSGDHGSRAQKGDQAANAAEAEAKKRARFDRALENARSKAQQNLAPMDTDGGGSATMPPPQPQAARIKREEEEPAAFLEELDSELSAAVARAARLAQLKERKRARDEKGQDELGQRVLQQMQQIKKEEEEDEGEDMDLDEVTTDGVSKNGGIVFTSTMEFSSRLQARLQERQRERLQVKEKEAARKEKDGDARKERIRQSELEAPTRQGMDKMDEDGEPEQQGARATKSRWVSTGQEEVPDEPMEQASESSDEDQDEQMDFVHRQPLVRSSMSAALAMLDKTGEMKEKHHLAGRKRDTRAFRGEKPDYDDGLVNIDYRDEFGRTLTRKEAFRQLSYEFHGHGPSKRKVEKRLKMVAEERKRLLATGDFTSLENQVKAQEATKQAYIPLSGGGAMGTATPAPLVKPMQLKKEIPTDSKAGDKTRIRPGT